MKKKFFPAIRAGRKTTTLRFWLHARVREGAVHTVPGLGRVSIVSVRPIALDALDDADARADGFADARELHAALDSLYPPPNRAGRTLYRVEFRLVEDATPGPAR